MGERLAEKVAVITGGSSGIGLASARLFVAEGARVVVAARDAERGAAAVAALRASGGDARYVPCDVTSAEHVARLVETTLAAYGRLDILFNHAGANRAARVTELDEAEWDALLNVNLKSVYLGCRFAIPAMLVNGGGCIVNTAGTFGLVARPAQAAYCAAKAAVIHLTRQMALDYGPQGVRVNCICPGYIDTPLTAGVPAAMRASIIAAQPLRRAGKPEDIAEAALYLASDASSFVTGVALPVDGGQLVSG
ncbi:MAG: SDR family oxidoreductase [Roseiflexaceae bacterium]|nr:SDR family oxidoreductase [Roseiflexaceae bacterium]